MGHVCASDVVSRVRTHLQQKWADASPAAASVTFLGLEPLEVLLFRPAGDELVHFATVGCSRHPMADPSEMITDSQRGPRAELVLSLRRVDESVTEVWKALARFAASPAVEGVVLVPDALLDAGEPLWPGAPFTAVLLGSDDAFDDVVLPEPASPVTFYSVVPITATEAAWVRLKGAPALRQAWTEAGIDVTDPSRGAAQPR
ncbi:MAG: suppressor of fused domain protein [Rhodococcus sp. (in: high G+C Gram-positive bacteria)]